MRDEEGWEVEIIHAPTSGPRAETEGCSDTA